jgi:hypothetical protein
MRSRMAGAGVEQMFYTLHSGMFYTLQAGLWRGDCGGNALHLHLICANNDDSHVLIIIISTLTLQVRQALFLALSVFPMCKKYSISEV